MAEYRLIQSARDAERAACDWMHSVGFVDATLTRIGTDGGVDIRSSHAIAQVKAEMKPAGSPVIQQLHGIATYEQTIGLFFSLAGYTRQARRWADAAGLPLFRFDLQSRVRPVNQAAADLLTSLIPELAEEARRAETQKAAEAAVRARREQAVALAARATGLQLTGQPDACGAKSHSDARPTPWAEQCLPGTTGSLRDHVSYEGHMFAVADLEVPAEARSLAPDDSILPRYSALVALRIADGAECWRHVIEGHIDDLIVGRGAAVLARRTQDGKGHAIGIDARSGSHLWTRKTGRPPLLAAGDDVVLMATRRRIHGCDPNTGFSNWRYTLPDGCWVASMTAGNGEVRFKVGDRDAKVNSSEVWVGSLAQAWGDLIWDKRMSEADARSSLLSPNDNGRRIPDAALTDGEPTSALAQHPNQEQVDATPFIAAAEQRRLREFELARFFRNTGPRATWTIFPHDVMARVWERDGARCSRCCSRDELIFVNGQPVDGGGPSNPRNVRLACKAPTCRI